ncbi:transposase [Agrobacterium salinitolerans]|nr:transposase [Agrobacterium salinitolerans]
MIEAVPERFEGAPRQFRRRWSDDFKERAVAEAMEPGANVSAIAPVRDLTACYHWFEMLAVIRSTELFMSSGRNEQTVSRSYGGMAPAFAFMPSGWRKPSSAGRASDIAGSSSTMPSFWLWWMEWTGNAFDQHPSSHQRLLGKTPAAN